MALKRCPECDKEISDRATRCPHCGYQRRPSFVVALITALLVALAFVLILLLSGVVVHG